MHARYTPHQSVIHYSAFTGVHRVTILSRITDTRRFHFSSLVLLYTLQVECTHPCYRAHTDNSRHNAITHRCWLPHLDEDPERNKKTLIRNKYFVTKISSANSTRLFRTLNDFFSIVLISETLYDTNEMMTFDCHF